MKKLLLLFVSFSMSISLAFSQLPNGATSPNFTLTDLNGASHDLYNDYLNLGIHVALDFSATWCPPCWSYHNSGAFSNFYANQGPNGAGVAMAFMMEADASTNTDCLYDLPGCNGNSMGDWVAGTSYPILDSPTSSESSNFSISYWPTIYMVNANDNRIFEVGQMGTQGLENWLLSFELDVTNVTTTDQDCFGNGSITLTTTGGFGTPAYIWSNGDSGASITDLAAGDYYVTMVDNNGYFLERGPYTVNLDNTNGAFNIQTTQQDDISCYGANDGYISVTVPDPDITYQWSNGSTWPFASNLGPGTHSLLVTNTLGCTDSRTFSLTEPPELISDITSSDPSCNQSNGQIVVSSYGGVPPYYYSLNGEISGSPTFNDLAAGDYDIVVTDFGDCQWFETVTLMAAPGPTATSSVSDVIDCEITEVELSASGSSGNASYEWFDDAGNSVGTGSEILVSNSGSYNLGVTDNSTGCRAESTTLVEEDYSVPTISSTDATLTCSSTEVQICMEVNGGSSSYWIINGQEVNEICVMVQSPGDYEAVAVGSNGCETSTMSTVDVDVNVPEAGIEEAETLTCENTLEVLSASVNGDVEDFEVSWSTADGNIVNQISALEVEVDEPGVYEMLVVNINSGCEVTEQIVVEQFINTPTSDFSAVNDDDFLHLEDLSDGEPTAWSWTVDGVQVSTQANYDFPLNGANQHVVCLEITNECGPDEDCKSVSIVDPVTLTVVSEDVKCFGDATGSIQVSAVGGVPPYTSQVVGPNSFNSDAFGLSNLIAGEYVFTIRDSETRVVNLNVTITEPPLLESGGSSSNLLCFESQDGSIDLNVEGGTPNYVYDWSNGSTDQDLNGLDAGDYSVLITDDNGCVTEQDFSITQPSIIENQGVVQDVSCFGGTDGTINISVSGGTGMLTLNWSDGLDGLINTNLPAGDYNLEIRDENNCESSSTFSITEPTQLEYVTEAVEDDFNGNGGSIDVSVSGGVSPYTFNWSNGADTEDLDDLTAGDYTLEILDANGCTLSTETYTIEFLSNVNEISALDHFSVYPNPVESVVNIDLEFKEMTDAKIEVLDMIGQRIMTKSIEGSSEYSVQFNLNGMTSGSYMLRISTQQGMALKKIALIN